MKIALNSLLNWILIFDIFVHHPFSLEYHGILLVKCYADENSCFSGFFFKIQELVRIFSTEVLGVPLWRSLDF